MGMRVVDLFAGSGGFSLGFKRAGFDLVGAFDLEPDAMAVHAANLPRVHRIGFRPPTPGGSAVHRTADLTDLLTAVPEISDLRPDVIIGGPPCQAFSPSGKRLGDEDPRARLTEAFAVAVAASAPRYFIMENVKEVASSAVFARAMRMLRRAGYGLSPELVDMSLHGVGQARKRMVVFGALHEADGWARAYLEGMRQPRPTTVRDVLGDEAGDVYFRMGHRSEDRVSFRSVDAPGVTVTTTADRRFTGAEGYVVTAADEAFLRSHGTYFMYPGGSSSSGTHSVDQPAATLTRRAGDGPGPNYVPRKGDTLDVQTLPLLTFEQLARLAGYPADWNWQPDPTRKLSKAARMLMIANSVPSPFSEVCGRVILAHDRNDPPGITLPVELPQGFAHWLAGPGGVPREHAGQRVSEARSAVRLLNGRACLRHEDAMRHLHAAPGFEDLSKSRRSNLNVALRLLYAYLDTLSPVDEAAHMEAMEREDAEAAPTVFPRSFVRVRHGEQAEAGWDEGEWLDAAE